jgi:hypothetical protein
MITVLLLRFLCWFEWKASDEGMDETGTLLAPARHSFAHLGGYIVTKKICLLTILLLAAVGLGCSNRAGEATNATATASPSPTETTAPGPDNSEIRTTVSADGTRTETRTFRNNPRVSKVTVITDRSGRRTVRATSPSGEERVVEKVENALEATGDAIADGAGFVADKGEDVAGEAADKAEDVGDKAVDTGKAVGEKTVDGAKTVGSKTVKGAKKVGEKTGDAVKKVIP